MLPVEWLEKNHESDRPQPGRPGRHPEHQHRRRAPAGDRADRRPHLRADAAGRAAQRRRPPRRRLATRTPTASGSSAPGKPTVFLYAHHDVQPVNVRRSSGSRDPWKLTRRDGRLFGRGAADDKGAIAAQLGAIAAYLKTERQLPVNVKMLVEGEEEVGSKNLLGFFERAQGAAQVRRDRRLRHREHRGRPAVHHLLAARHRGRARSRCRAPTMPVHSGMAGGACRTRPSP